MQEQRTGKILAIRGDQRFVSSLLRRWPQLALMIVEDTDSPSTIWRWVQEHAGPRLRLLYFFPTEGTRESWGYWTSRCDLALETTDRRYANVVSRNGKAVKDDLRAKITSSGLAVQELVE